MLELRDVSSYYGRIEALKGISLTVREGEIVCLIGANGAGKSTVLNTVSGIVRAARGSIRFRGEDITGISPNRIVGKGVVQVPEGRAILTSMTVQENLELGAFLRTNTGEVHHDLEAVFGRFPVLEKKALQSAGTLSGGEQQMLAMGRALMTRPKILLLDEPSMGLSPLLVREIFSIIQEINRQGTAVLLVEQNAGMALSVSTRGYVLETGRIVFEDSAENLMRNVQVIKAYLGG